jgi:hypothetical protein
MREVEPQNVELGSCVISACTNTFQLSTFCVRHMTLARRTMYANSNGALFFFFLFPLFSLILSHGATVPVSFVCSDDHR